MVDLSLYKVGVVTSLAEKADRGNSKPLKICQVDVGDGSDITVVTSATNVREKSRLVVAPVGSKVLDNESNEQDFEIIEAVVGGVKSYGMFCDTKMLGWSGSSASGIAAQIPDTFSVGSIPPSEKPGLVSFQEKDKDTIPAVDVKPLFEKKLTKEEKKKIAEEKRLARKASKESKKKIAEEN